MAAPSSPVRAHLRGLEVLQALNRRNYSSALQLSKDTGLPRPTVYRLLMTLVDAGFVAHAKENDSFCLTSAVQSLSCGFDASAKALEACRDVAQRLSAQLGWPVYIHIPDGDAMVLRQKVSSPKELISPNRHRRVSLLECSPGRALLASMDEARREEVLHRLLPTAAGKNVQALREARRVIRDTVLLGCGFRDEGLVPRTCSVSLPVRVEKNPAAFMTVVVMKAVMSLNRTIDTCLPATQAAVHEIERSLQAA
jgi:DNA-binding IclR family transcriptional regulator